MPVSLAEAQRKGWRWDGLQMEELGFLSWAWSSTCESFYITSPCALFYPLRNKRFIIWGCKISCERTFRAWRAPWTHFLHHSAPHFTDKENYGWGNWDAKIKVGEIKPFTTTACLLTWLGNSELAGKFLQPYSSGCWHGPTKNSWRGLSKLSSLTESALSCLRPLLFDKTSNGEDDLGAGDRQISIHPSIESKMVSTLLPSSNLTQIPPSVNANLRLIRKRNCGKYFFSSFRHM